jgi:hypothetical protein
MTQPRSTLVCLDATPWYHIASRCAHGALPAGMMPGIAHESPASLALRALRDATLGHPLCATRSRTLIYQGVRSYVQPSVPYRAVRRG